MSNQGTRQNVLRAEFLQWGLYRLILARGHVKHVRTNKPGKWSNCGECVRENVA